jgi:hypothetical protein
VILRLASQEAARQGPELTIDELHQALDGLGLTAARALEDRRYVSTVR